MRRAVIKIILSLSAILFCINIISCASASFTASEPCFIPEDFFGITPERTNLEEDVKKILDDFNAVWIRDTIRWSGVEQGEGNWIFNSWDEYIGKAEAAGKKLVLVLGFDNPWLYENKKENRDFTDRELQYFLKYIEQVVSRYKTRVIYEIWNEPNWVFWNGSDKKFFKVSAAAAQKIRETEPNAIILAGSTSRFDKKFTEGLFKAGAMNYTDGFSVHPYGISPEDTMKQVDNLKKIYKKYNYEKPIWITEVGFSTGPISFCNIKRYPEYIVKTLSGLSIRANDVRHLIWYELMDEYNPGEEKNYLDPLNYFGLIYPNKNFKPGAHAFMLTAQFLAGSEHNPKLPLREGINKNVTSLYFKKEQTGILILWKKGLGKDIHLLIPEAENIKIYNIKNGEAKSLLRDSIIKTTREPVIITWTGGEAPQIKK